MLINYNIKADVLESNLSFGCFKVENLNNVIFIQLSFNLLKNKEVLSFLKNVTPADITNELIEKNISGGYFIFIYCKITKQIKCLRDVSGIKTAYYLTDVDSNIIISTNCHQLARETKLSKICKEITDMILTSEFILDGYTIYDNIKEFEKGSYYLLNSISRIQKVTKSELNLASKDNSLSYSENKLKLKNSILNAHEKLVGKSNIIYLSGGIDSCVMLASLDEVVGKNKLENVSYRVKGTSQDETKYALKASKFLGYNCEIIEIDPKENIHTNDLESKILEMNNPYIGILIFDKINCEEGVHHFAGQDSRLHTPDVNQFTNYLFNNLIKLNTINKQANFITNFILHYFYKSKLPYSKNKFLKNLDQIFLILFDKKNYLHKIILKNNEEKFNSFGLENVNNKLRDNYFNFDNLGELNHRKLYNLIVSKKWGEQYTDDIRYMVDMGYSSNNFMQMPFYDIELARFSSSIPFKYSSNFTVGTDQFSNSPVKVNKVLLREAFDGKISPDVVYRKKAVSHTIFLLFNGNLGKLIKLEMEHDLNSNYSFIKEYNYSKLVKKFISKEYWSINDQSYLLKIYYLYTFIVYNKNII